MYKRSFYWCSVRTYRVLFLGYLLATVLTLGEKLQCYQETLNAFWKLMLFQRPCLCCGLVWAIGYLGKHCPASQRWFVFSFFKILFCFCSGTYKSSLIKFTTTSEHKMPARKRTRWGRQTVRASLWQLLFRMFYLGSLNFYLGSLN